MKAVILAGGVGSRISEESHLKPKPMIEIGGMPILWHIMKIYSHHGVNEFIICCGYKGYMIKEYFSNYFLHMSDITIDLSNNEMEIHRVKAESWKVTMVDTGNETMTGGRLKRVKPYLSANGPFCLTYGDGVSNVDISELIRFHNQHGLNATLTAAYPPGRFGALDIQENNLVSSFKEKPKGDGGMINAGFFVLSPDVIDLVDGDSTIFEREPLERLAAGLQLAAYPHTGFWQPMDTMRDKNHLEQLWESGNAPWKVWK
jgi:glucose-1-phosphate cytidylyltransferase